MRKKLAATLIAATLALGACGGTTAEATIDLVDAPAAQELLAAPPTGLVVLDVRTPEEFGAGRIADSVNLDFYAADFVDRLDALDKDVPYFVYCRSGNRSGQTIETMRDLGFTEVYELDGGIVSWAASGLPIE